MTTHGAVPHANSAGCNYEPVLYPHAPSTLCTASRHGTRAAYAHGCRCPIARAAYVRYQKQWHYDQTQGRRRRVPTLGAQRRIRALMANGWPLLELSRRLGRRGRLNLARHATITASLHGRVAALYDELADVRGPSLTAAALAIRRGWLPPIWWDDDLIDAAGHDPQASLFIDDIQLLEIEKKIRDIDPVAVERFITDDDPQPLNRAEKTEAYQALLARGVSHNQAAIRLKLSGSTAKKLARIVDVRAQVVGVHEDRGANDTRSAAV